MKKLDSALFVLVVFAFFSCTKTAVGDNDGEGPKQSTAEFQLAASDDVCSMITLHGSYYAGAPMTSDDYLKIKVNITKPGTLYYSTDVLNGFYFSISDTLDEPGTYEVILQGHGMPVDPGNSKFAISHGDTRIYYTIPVVQQAVQLEDVPDEIYMKGKFGGESFHIVFPGDENNVAYTLLNNDTVEVSTFVNPGPGGGYPGYGALSLQKQYLRGMNAATEEDFLAFFTPGSYPIAFDKCGHYTDGVWLGWVDEHNESWLVTPGGDQEGSSYTIVGVEDGHRTDGKYYVRVKARITCNLYNQSAQNKKLENVEIVSCFVMAKN